jgi:predicted dehydrogenase
MANSLNWGILATGSIARQFAAGLKRAKRGTLRAVGSRTLESAQAFTREFGGTPHGSYEAVLNDPAVDAVYIATPHHLHAEWTVRCAEAGKGILCEKPFVLSAPEAEGALNAVRKHGVFFMEAFMYRCHPQTLKLRQILGEGVIGEVKMVNAEFGFAASHDWGNFRTVNSLGGGGLMDVGVYPLTYSRMIAGEEPDRLEYSAYIGEKGYDEYGAGLIGFPCGMIAHFGTGIHLNQRNGAWIYGTEGMIHVEEPWKCREGSAVHVMRIGKKAEDIKLGTSNDQLYAYEADAVAEFFDARECPHMTIADTLGNMRALDALRESAGLRLGDEVRA